MKKNIDLFGNYIYNADTRKAIKKENDNSYDLILSDPPYNINYTNNRRIKTRDKIHGVDGIMNDIDNLEMIEEVYNEYFRILKEGKHIYIFTKWSVSQDHILLLEKAGFIIKNNLIWCKNSWSMGDLYGDYAGQYENIIFGYKPYSKGSKKGKGNKLNKIGNKTRHSNVLFFNRVVGKQQIHSHQKPIDLLQFLIQKSTKVGEKVYDGFIGSNSLGIAASSVNRKYAGVELNPEVFDKLENITNTKQQLLLNKLENIKDIEYIDDLNLLLIPDGLDIKHDINIKNNKKLKEIKKEQIIELHDKENYFTINNKHIFFIVL